MTDWTTTTDSTAGEISAAGCIRAGNDLVMPGSPRDIANIKEELEKGTLSEEELKACVRRIIKICLASNQYEGPQAIREILSESGFLPHDSKNEVKKQRI